MRCKNCGADNDDNRYICEVCGSPLYDEDDFDNAANDDNDKTQTFKAVNGENYQPQNNNNNNNNDYNDNQYGKQQNNNGSSKIPKKEPDNYCYTCRSSYRNRFKHCCNCA